MATSSGTASDVAVHDWLVEEREYLRMEDRRGRRHAYERLDPRRTALVVVDVVPFFVEQSAYCRGIVAPINTLAAALRAAGGVVAWVVPGFSEPSAKDREFLGSDIADMFARSGGEGEPVERIWSGLDVTEGDLAVEKTSYSAYLPGSSELPELLAERGVDTLIVTGTVTNVCVEATVRDASVRDLRVIVVPDACAARRDQDHNAALHTIYRVYGDVRPTDEVLELIRDGQARAARHSEASSA